MFENFFKIEIANTVRQKLKQVVFIKHFKLAVWYEKGITARFRATANLGLNKLKLQILNYFSKSYTLK